MRGPGAEGQPYWFLAPGELLNKALDWCADFGYSSVHDLQCRSASSSCFTAWR
jgi:hypothetical protein